MMHFYDGVIRKYLLQIIRAFSNFTVKYNDGTLIRVPVMYGDMDRMVANILRQNSDNVSSISTPKITVSIARLELDRDRLADSTFVSKIHIRERGIANGAYTNFQGRNYTVERLMPTPYKLSVKVDIWASNTDQKLQLLEQILVLFNPSLEIQTNDNYIDWTSLSVLTLYDVNWNSNNINTSDVSADIATLTLDSPIWISPPVKVKHMGVITNIISSIFEDVDLTWKDIDGLGTNLTTGGTINFDKFLFREYTTITGYNIQILNSRAILINQKDSPIKTDYAIEHEIKENENINWLEVFEQYPGRHIDGITRLFVPNRINNGFITGTVELDPQDHSILLVNWDPDTYPRNYGIDSNGKIEHIDPDYDGSSSFRSNSPGTFDAIIDPLTKGPRGSGLPDPTIGTRYMIIEAVGSDDNTSGPTAWRGDDGSDLVAEENDIIEWTGIKWHVIFDASNQPDILIYQTNTYTNIQYCWNGVSWIKSFEGFYADGEWRIEMPV